MGKRKYRFGQHQANKKNKKNKKIEPKAPAKHFGIDDTGYKCAVSPGFSITVDASSFLQPRIKTQVLQLFLQVFLRIQVRMVRVIGR